MPAKRKAAQKTPPAESSRPSRSTSSRTGTKRKASPSPAPPAKKGVGALKEAGGNDSKESTRQSARGRSVSKPVENKQKEEPKTRGGSRTSHATRAVVEAEESKRASSRGRSKTPSTPQKTNTTPKSTPKAKTETSKQKTTPRAATPRQRSATPKSKPSTPKQATPKQKAATPKQKAVTPKQKNTTPKQKAVTPKPKQDKQKNTPKPKQVPKQKQKPTPEKSPSKKTPKKKEESPNKSNDGESATESDTKKSPDSANKKRRSPTKREITPTKPSRTSSRSRGKEEKAEEEKEIDQDEETDTTKEETAENNDSEAAEVESEQKEESEEKTVLNDDKENLKKDENDKPEQKENDVEEMETEEAGNEDENVEQDQIVEKNENAEAEEVAAEESKENKPKEQAIETISAPKAESMEVQEAEAKEGKTESVEAEAKEEEKTEAVEAEKEEEAEAKEEEKAEAIEAEEEEVEQEEVAEAVQEPVSESETTQKDESSEAEISSIVAEPAESVQNVDDVKESQAESEQVVIEDNENESVESEQVEADAQEPEADSVTGDPIVINEESGDSVQPEVISDESENGDGKVIEVNDDSGDAVIVMDSNEIGSGDNDNVAKVTDDVQVLNAEAEQPVVNLDDDTGVELGEEAIENDFASTSDLTGNGTSHLEDVDNKKRKIDEVEDAEDSGEFSKKVKSSVEVESVTENGTVSQEEENIDDEFVVIEMSDVPPTDSNEVKESIPQEVVTNNIDTDNIANPIFNREYIPNPAFSGSGDILKQFSVVSYNILADCHLFRNDYSFTDSKYLVPEYRLEKIIEELKYLDGDIICMQEVDPTFFSEKLLPSLQSVGYEGFHKKRTTEYFNEGEATFYKTGRFTLVESQLHRQADLVEQVLSEGSVDASIQEAVRKYMDMPDVLVVTKLRCNNTGSEITVGNVHINWGEMKTPDVQCVQVASAIKETVNKAGGEGVPHIICGDFNSPPDSPGYVVARDGYPNGDETITKLQQITGLQLPEGKVDSLVNCLWPAFQHTSSALKSAYFEVQGQEPEITSYNQVMCECVDYIFYSSTSIDNIGVYRVPAKDRIMETGGTPNLYFPSDHVSMKAVLSFK